MAIFRKIYFFVFLFSIFFTINSYSEVVNKVEVQGNQRISLETIIIFGDIIQGKNYEREDISLLIKKLYETSFFSNISVELLNNKLTIVVEENPIEGIIGKIDISLLCGIFSSGSSTLGSGTQIPSLSK